jgi:hypothetical protein
MTKQQQQPSHSNDYLCPCNRNNFAINKHSYSSSSQPNDDDDNNNNNGRKYNYYILRTLIWNRVIITTYLSKTHSACNQFNNPAAVLQGGGKGIVTAILQTNSTGILAPLNGMILAGIDDFTSDGNSRVTLWRWESGIPP